MKTAARPRRRRKKNRDWKKLARFLRNLLVLTLSVLAIYYFSQSPFFALKKIEAKGNNKLTAPEIIKKSGLSPGMNYFDLDLELAKKRLSSIPLIEDVDVQKRIPDQVVISLKERESRALICTNGSFVVIDEKGYCIEKCGTTSNYDLPIITGLQPDTLTPGEQVSKREYLGAVLAVLDKDVQTLVSEINIAAADNLVAYTRQGIPVLLGTTEKLPEKLTMAKSYLELIGTVEGIEYIDIRSVQAPAVKCQNKNSKDKEKIFSVLET